MTKQSNKIAYPNDNNISDNDYLGGTDGDTNKKFTKSYQISDLRDYILQGLNPELGGTLKIIEINYEGILTTPHEVANQLDPNVIILQYEIAVFNINGDKYLLKLQNVTIGLTEDDILESDFIALDLVGVNLAGGISTFKGLNSVTGREEHYSLESTGLNISKEVIVDVETGKILIEQKAQTNLGNGTLIYKGFNSISKLQEFYTISSPDHNISIIDNEIVISNPASSEVLQFIVNSDYTDDEELGTVIKPFKNLQNAVIAYIGTGTNIVPQYSGYTIKVLKDVNIFTGSLAIHNLTVDTDVFIQSNPSTGNYLLDVDADATLPIGMTPFAINDLVRIALKGSGGFSCKKRGIKNRGTQQSANLSRGKQITVSCNLHSTLEATDVNRTLIECNKENLAGYFNDMNVANINLIDNASIYTKNSNLITCGLNSIINANSGDNVLIQFSDNINSFDTTIKPLIISGGYLNIVNGLIQSYLDGGIVDISNAVDDFITISNTGNLTIQNSIIKGYSKNFITNDDTTQSSVILINNSALGMTVYEEVLKSISVVWTNLKLINNYINGNIDSAQIVLIPNTTNIINSQIVETLTTYINKEVAITAGLFKGCKYIKRTTITTGAFVVGEDYEILNIGDTDFTLIGASANTVGLIFTATGVGGGTTGTAYFDKLDII
jgi:hypothetical protein